jgi:uncharacterized membrane protein (DUF4010 family)
MEPLSQLDAAWRLTIAALVGLGVGVEREWSGHASGPHARFAGVRTMLLLGLLGGAAGLLLAASLAAVAVVIAGAGGALAVAAYVMAVRRPGTGIDGTTETAALLVIALGVLAGVGWLGLAAGTGTIVVLALREKTRLHWFVSRLDEDELRAALQFAAMALVVLPVLPAGPVWGALELRPRVLWAVVLVFSGLNFGGYIARRAVGPERGYGFAGALGGVISSTAVTLTHARHSRSEPAYSRALARGVIAACTVLVARVLILSSVLYPPIGIELAPLLAPQAIAGVVAVALMSRANEPHHGHGPEGPSNPLRLGTAVRMAIVFQAGLVLLSLAHGWWGTLGVYASGALLGTTDMDALTFSMSRADAAVSVATAARVIAVGVIANSTLKLGISLAFGAPSFRRSVAGGFVALIVAGALGLLIV